MHLLRRSYNCIPKDSRVIAALGVFDGVHLGHQQILKRVIAIRDAWRREGQKAYTLMLSFHPHPVCVLGRQSSLPFISTLWQRVYWTEGFGIDYFNLIHFTPKFAALSARDFIRDILIEKARVSCLVVGADARVGSGAKGDLSVIEQELRSSAAVLDVLPDEIINGRRISSGALRSFLSDGRLDEAKMMLGRPFEMEGRVVSGDKRGRQLGFPTLNLLRCEQICPPGGVYLSRVVLPDGSCRCSLTNVGNRPTFGGLNFRVETHVLDFEGPELYGKRIRVSFLKKLREERCFTSVDALKEQMQDDKAAARDFFKCV